MFIEPAYRGRSLGRLALEVIAFLHRSVADCDYTILVADDDGSGKLAKLVRAGGRLCASTHVARADGQPRRSVWHFHDGSNKQNEKQECFWSGRPHFAFASTELLN